MKTAIITPPTLLGRVVDTKYNLILAHWLHNKRYADYYSHPGAGFVIMDNGAAEGEMPTHAELLKIAVTGQKPSALVCPDVLFDKEETLKEVMRFRNRAAYHDGLMDFWAVAQGRTYEEVRDCALEYIERSVFRWIEGICLPRLMNREDPYARARLADELHDRLDGRSLHCLGSGSWTREAIILASMPHVTGIDTSAPIVMGLLGLDIEISDYPGRSGLKTPYPATRVEDYEVNRGLIDHNIATYLHWTRSLLR